MKSWFKFFGLGFFSNKITKEARIRGVLNCVLGFVLALVFIFLGVLSANAVPFYSHYDNADDFKELVRGALAEGELSADGGLLAAESVVNTFTSDSDAAMFARNGYNLVIDTRHVEALDDFIAYCELRGTGERISYEEYRALSVDEQSRYDFKIEYTPEELVLTDSLIMDCEEYLSACDGEISETYAELLNSKGNDGYEIAIYALYLKAYYPELIAYESDGVPLLRSYYYINYVNRANTSNSLFIFEEVVFGYFTTGRGVEVSFYGSYEKLLDGLLTADGADEFIKSSFSSTVSDSAGVYLLNIFRFIPIIALIPVMLALIAKIALALFKDDKFKQYTTCLKIEFSFLFMGAIFAAIITFICGFFVSSATLNALPLIIFAAVLAVRTAVFLCGEYIVIKNTSQTIEKNHDQ